MSETTLPNKGKIWLYNLHLGYPSFNTLEIMFPHLFQKVDKQMFHCDASEFAKHKRVDFPSSNKNMTIPFALIENYVWGPPVFLTYMRIIGLSYSLIALERHECFS